MTAVAWVRDHGGIVHRDAVRARFPPAAVRRAISDGELRRVRSWLVADSADRSLVGAAVLGGRLGCVSLGRLRGWWMPHDLDAVLHIALPPHGRRPPAPHAVLHWTEALSPASLHSPQVSVEDALMQIADCVPREDALAIWESAVKVESLSPDALRLVPWKHPAARECAASVTGLSDSGLETVFITRLRHWRVLIRQQVVLAGRPVDILIGDRLVVQIDGWAHHSSAAQREKDSAHDAELRLRGYTVFRFGYARIFRDWHGVERVLARAVAAGLHLS